MQCSTRVAHTTSQIRLLRPGSLDSNQLPQNSFASTIILEPTGRGKPPNQEIQSQSISRLAILVLQHRTATATVELDWAIDDGSWDLKLKDQRRGQHTISVTHGLGANSPVFPDHKFEFYFTKEFANNGDVSRDTFPECWSSGQAKYLGMDADLKDPADDTISVTNVQTTGTNSNDWLESSVSFEFGRGLVGSGNIQRT